jgi:hypothetical protein
VDSRALKSINIISRYVQQLRYLDLSNNQLTHLDEKTIKLINQNKKFIIVGKNYELKEAWFIILIFVYLYVETVSTSFIGY